MIGAPFLVPMLALLTMAAAEEQHRELEEKIRIRYRSNRQISPGVGLRRKLEEEGDSRSPATFYSARLGQYDIQNAVETLPRQLDLLRTIATSKTNGVAPRPDEPCRGRLPLLGQAHAGTRGQGRPTAATRFA